jgi:hypothetical protein
LFEVLWEKIENKHGKKETKRKSMKKNTSVIEDLMPVEERSGMADI